MLGQTLLIRGLLGLLVLIAGCSSGVVDQNMQVSNFPGKGPPLSFEVHNNFTETVKIWVQPVAKTRGLGTFSNGPETIVQVAPGEKTFRAKTDESTYDEVFGYIELPWLKAKGFSLVIGAPTAEGSLLGPVFALGHPADDERDFVADGLFYKQWGPEANILSEERSKLLPQGKAFPPTLTAYPTVLITIDPQGAVTFSLTPETIAQLVDAP